MARDYSDPELRCPQRGARLCAQDVSWAADRLFPLWIAEKYAAGRVSAKQLIEIYPNVPTALARLPELSNNLFFSWHRPTRALFEDLDPELWQQTGGNPRLMLRCINQENLDRAAADAEYLERYRPGAGDFRRLSGSAAAARG